MFDTSMFDLRPAADPKAVVKGEKYRFTVLTDRLIRLEYSENGVFVDAPTQRVFCRRFPVPEFEVKETETSLEIITKKLHLYYNKQRFTEGGLSIRPVGMQKHKCCKWHFGMDKIKVHNEYINLGGTVSTLDSIDGAIPLGDGLIDRHGFSLIDDSKTMLLNENGWFEPKKDDSVDVYFFAYLFDHKGCIRDFYALSGKSPMLPRYALGNWWSRYYKYTEKSYLALTDEFEKRGIPLSVAVIDMDWHITRPEEKYGNGWTGYTWNRDFFPDPERFLSALHAKGLTTSLNLHPCDGIRAFEDNYLPMAKAMGVDFESEEPVQFDASDEKFMKNYFEKILHPLEDQGVDLWWIDWQQKGGFSKDGYDVLFMLNHYHFADSARKGKYPMTFSRYAGIGSQRYPIGFSGDTVMTWDSLDFQPYFTSTASNVGYSWWSHDIGGHTRGVWDEELQIRWLEYGVFSPIMRLHSSSNPFLNKEPWAFGYETEKIMTDYMRLRHRLIPYLYTMAYRNAEEGVPLVCPMYYDYPQRMTSEKKYPNEYTFGSELIVSPVTSKSRETSRTGRVDTFIPEGKWIDVFTHRIYKGEKEISLYRTKEYIPVLAKAGAIIPLDLDARNGAKTPDGLEIQVFCGNNGAFTLYEDDGMAKNTKKAFTDYAFEWGERSVFTACPARGEFSSSLPERTIKITFVCPAKFENVKILRNGVVETAEISTDGDARTASVTLRNVRPTDGIEVSFDSGNALASSDKEGEIVKTLVRCQIENELKHDLYKALKKTGAVSAFIAAAARFLKDDYILGEIVEILTSDK